MFGVITRYLNRRSLLERTRKTCLHPILLPDDGFPDRSTDVFTRLSGRYPIILFPVKVIENDNNNWMTLTRLQVIKVRKKLLPQLHVHWETHGVLRNTLTKSWMDEYTHRYVFQWFINKWRLANYSRYILNTILLRSRLSRAVGKIRVRQEKWDGFYRADLSRKPILILGEYFVLVRFMVCPWVHLDHVHHECWMINTTRRTLYSYFCIKRFSQLSCGLRKIHSNPLKGAYAYSGYWSDWRTPQTLA